jgi:hypothetical protein
MIHKKYQQGNSLQNQLSDKVIQAYITSNDILLVINYIQLWYPMETYI